MKQLTPRECRVLGVLIEKAQTTPAQYPITLNALTNGCNQKSNRLPVLNLTEEEVLESLDHLRAQDLVREVMMSGSRVEKFRHLTREKLEISTSELVILAEMLLRGPQTVGEIRNRASRMHPLESTDVVQNLLQNMMDRPEPLVRKLAAAPGSRAPRYAQLLCPDLHPLDAHPVATTGASIDGTHHDERVEELMERVESLESELARLRDKSKR